MLNYFIYLQTQYLGQKGQGLVEYAVVVAVVIGIGIAFLANNDDGVARTISNVYTNVFNRANNLNP